MQLVEQHIIKKQHPFYKECDELCFKSKNLYFDAYIPYPKGIGVLRIEI